MGCECYAVEESLVGGYRDHSCIGEMLWVLVFVIISSTTMRHCVVALKADPVDAEPLLSPNMSFTMNSVEFDRAAAALETTAEISNTARSESLSMTCRSMVR